MSRYARHDTYDRLEEERMTRVVKRERERERLEYKTEYVQRADRQVNG